MPDVSIIFMVKDGALLTLPSKVPGKLQVIGGKADPGETPEQTALREAEEETGLRLTDFTHRGRVQLQWPSDEQPYYADLFVATGFEGELRGSHEGVPNWVPLTEVEKLPYLGYVKVWLPLLLSDGPALSGLYRVDAAGDVLA